MTRREMPNWVYQGAGEPPESVSIFRAEAEITTFASLIESGDFVAADSSGVLYRLDSFLGVSLITRVDFPVQKLSWSATGHFGVALTGKKTLKAFNSQLKPLWAIDLPATCSTLSVDPFGSYVFVGFEIGSGAIYSSSGKKVSRVETLKPVQFSTFLVNQPLLIAAAGQGLLAAYNMRGQPNWEERIWSHVSDLCLVQEKNQICLAAQNHGIKVHNLQGDSIGALVLEGTANRISSSYTGQNIFASTQERHLYRINQKGDLLWAAKTPQSTQFLFAHAANPSGVVVFDNGTAMRLGW